ncbi:U6 snRNA phosphodiesterase Usb1 [Fomes fomentarius]|nr:U6 snRNA phosphodiesterase Usb1 [Fomes fomentarius]
MKGATLVEYSSSDEDGDQEHPPPLIKKRKLPSLAEHLVPRTPADNPALHQGRRRTTPHVDGQFAAYVYVPVPVSKQSRLFRLVKRIFMSAKEDIPSLHPIAFVTDESPEPDKLRVELDNETVELHISLTRPTYLRAHQRQEFRRAVQAVARAKQKFSASFATITELTNDERTRTFLTLEIGAGHDDLKSLSNALGPTLRSLRQKEFYEDARFHVSIAWALLDGAQDLPPVSTAPESHSTVSHASTGSTSDNSPPQSSMATTFPTIPSFPASLIPRLQRDFSRELVSVGSFEADEVHVRIGKEVKKWNLLP